MATTGTLFAREETMGSNEASVLLIEAEEGKAIPAAVPDATAAGNRQYGGTSSSSEFTEADYRTLSAWMERSNGNFHFNCMSRCIDPGKLPGTAKRQAIFPKLTADELQRRMAGRGQSLEGGDEREAIECAAETFQSGAADGGKSFVGISLSRTIVGFWGFPSLFVCAVDRFSKSLCGCPRPVNRAACVAPIVWNQWGACHGGHCGNEDARYSTCYRLAVCLYFGSLIVAAYDVAFTLAMYAVAPAVCITAMAIDAIAAICSLIFVWGFMTLGRQGWYPFQETVSIGLVEGYPNSNTLQAKLGRQAGCGSSLQSHMKIEEVLSKKNNIPCAKMCCTSRLCYHPAEAIVSDDMCMTFYTYGDAMNTNLSAGDVGYFRQAHQQLRSTWEAAMGGGLSG